MGASPLLTDFLRPLLGQPPFPSRAAIAPHEQTPCLITLPPPNHLFANAHPRIPLVKKKSLRKNLIEHGLLEDYLKTHSINPASKYLNEAASMMATQPLENYMDVSAWAGGRGSSEVLARRREGVPGVLEDGPGL